MLNYNPRNWYWLADDGRLFSSASQSLIAPGNESYLNWISLGNSPTPWPKNDDDEQTYLELQDVLTPYGLFCDLVTYANAKQWAIVTGGRVVQIAGQPVLFSTTSDSLSLMNGKVSRLGQPNPPSHVNWQVGPTTFVSIAAADFISAAVSVSDWVQSLFDALPAIFTGISNGTITNIDQIDAALAVAGV